MPPINKLKFLVSHLFNVAPNTLIWRHKHVG